MQVIPLSQDLVPAVKDLMELGAPFVRVRTDSDYWLYARLFGSSCPVALDDGTVIGAVVAFRSQEDPDEVYIQDVITHPDYRHQGVAKVLLETVRDRATEWGCSRIYLTSEPDNHPAHTTWTSLGFTNVPGDRTEHGVSVTADFKGPGKDRAVYELPLR